ncbi:MAG TPA: GNAT family N-acetyltransferase [Ktedonobacterales bacterium]|nr:GNAT family N-acetyltransferase [Ktedonobacterales bacterium]
MVAMASEGGSGIVRATLADVGRIAAMLARAFQHDPLMRYAIPDAGQRRRLLPRLIALNVRYGCRYGEVYTTPNYEGAAIWLSPGQTRMTLWRILRAGIFTAPLWAPWPALRRLAVSGDHSASLHARCLTGPHWYLAQIGVEPAAQRQGLASRLLRPMLARIDAANLPCYLETENAANIMFYQRLGFHVAAEDTSPGYPPIWGMIRSGSGFPPCVGEGLGEGSTTPT